MLWLGHKLVSQKGASQVCCAFDSKASLANALAVPSSRHCGYMRHMQGLQAHWLKPAWSPRASHLKPTTQCTHAPHTHTTHTQPHTHTSTNIHTHMHRCCLKPWQFPGMSGCDRPLKLRKLAHLRNDCPYISKSALEKLLAWIKKGCQKVRQPRP